MDYEFHIFHYQATPKRDSLCFTRALRVRLKCHSMDSVWEEERQAGGPLERENSLFSTQQLLTKWFLISYTLEHLPYNRNTVVN